MRRRGFLKGVSMLGASALTPVPGGAFGAARELYEDDDDCGVASGDPAHDSVTLWTRVPAAARSRAFARAPRKPGSREPESLEVRWWIGERRAGVVTVLDQGRAQTSARRDWTVKVRVQGLPTGGLYVYGFSLGDAWRSDR